MRCQSACVALLMIGAIGCQPGDSSRNSDGSVQSDAKRDEYMRELQANLDQADKDFDDLRAKAARATGDAKAKLEQRLQELEPQRQKARKELEQLRGDSKRAWHEVKSGMDQSWSTLRDSLQRAREEFK